MGATLGIEDMQMPDNTTMRTYGLFSLYIWEALACAWLGMKCLPCFLTIFQATSLPPRHISKQTPFPQSEALHVEIVCIIGPAKFEKR